MSRKTKAQQFKEIFDFWIKHLGIKKQVPVIIDNRHKHCVQLCNWNDDERIAIRINPRRMGHWDEDYLYCTVFHELGHIIHDLPYNNDEEEVYSEFRAECFSLSMLKLHFPNLYKENNRKMKHPNASWRKDRKKHPNHYEAYKKIREYT